jgi:hypothetical protein
MHGTQFIQQQEYVMGGILQVYQSRILQKSAAQNVCQEGYLSEALRQVNSNLQCIEVPLLMKSTLLRMKILQVVCT